MTTAPSTIIKPQLGVSGRYLPNADGFDISHWNKLVRPNAMHPGKYSIMTCKATEGGKFVSPTLVSYWNWMQSFNPRYLGAYHWIRPDVDPVVQAGHYINTMKPLVGDFKKPGIIYQLDWEVTPDGKGGNLPPVPVDWINTWIDAVEKFTGVGRVIVYASDWVPGFRQWRMDNPGRAVWYANYNLNNMSTSGWPESQAYGATVWQWTSTYGDPAFSGGIDMNHIIRPLALDRVAGISINDKEEEDEDMFAAIMKHKDHEAIYVAYKGGYKTWVAPGSMQATISLLKLSGIPDSRLGTVVIDSNSMMRATGPIMGPIPAGVDAYGCPA